MDQVLKFIVAMSLACIAGMFIAEARASEAVLTYNPDRSGEGAAIFVEDETLVLTFYTFTDAAVSYPPTVSPYIPPPYVTLECVNTPIWYVGVASDWDGDSAKGILYADRPFNYPFPVGTAVSESEEIGNFVILRDQEGFDFYVDWVENDVLPNTVSLYGSVYELWLPLARVGGN